MLVLILVGAFFVAGIYMTKNRDKSDSNSTISTQSPNKTEIKIFDSKNANEKAENSDITIQSEKVHRVAIEKDGAAEVDGVNLYSNLPNNVLPLSGIYELYDLSPEALNSVQGVINRSENIYLVKKLDDKLMLVTENSENLRHGIDFVEISLANGHQTRTTLGYSDKMKDSNNDNWVFDDNSEYRMPVKHTKYKKDGNVDFIEIWNYDDSEPVKYEMKDGDGKVIAIKKETIDDGNLRVEHLIYDKTGATKINVSATYEDENLKRFTYYNADKPRESASVFGEYTDGYKTKETVYTDRKSVV